MRKTKAELERELFELKAAIATDTIVRQFAEAARLAILQQGRSLTPEAMAQIACALQMDITIKAVRHNETVSVESAERTGR